MLSARVVDTTDRPIALAGAADVWQASLHGSSFETRLKPEDAYVLALDLLRAAARVGVKVREKG